MMHGFIYLDQFGFPLQKRSSKLVKFEEKGLH